MFYTQKYHYDDVLYFALIETFPPICCIALYYVEVRQIGIVLLVMAYPIVY